METCHFESFQVNNKYKSTVRHRMALPPELTLKPILRSREYLLASLSKSTLFFPQDIVEFHLLPEILSDSPNHRDFCLV